jgi:hypothetical protein
VRPGDPPLAAPLRAYAHGLYPTEAGIELLISHRSFLARTDFRDRFIRLDTSIINPTITMAEIGWTAAITALDAADLPCSGGEQRILRLAASLAGGVPVDLGDTLTGLDNHNINLLIAAVLHASGRPQTPQEP